MNNAKVLGDQRIRLKDIVDENFQDYKKPSMFISAISCDFKCLRELSMDIKICQNMQVCNLPNKCLEIKNIYKRYISNPLTQAIIIGGLEPMLQFKEIFSLIEYFRSSGCFDDFVIYTGYYPSEIKKEVEAFKELDNIIIKYGRFIPNSTLKYDRILGVSLSSENQYAEKVS